MIEKLPELPLADTASAVETEYPKLIADYVLDGVLTKHYTPDQARTLYRILTTPAMPDGIVPCPKREEL